MDAGSRLSDLPPPSGAARGGPRRILFVGEACTIAHVARPAVLARWAREAGHQVFFACGEAYAQVARMEGLDPLPLPNVPMDRVGARIERGRFFLTEDELEEYVQAEWSVLRRLQPHLVVGDFRLSLPISAALAGIPMLALLNAHWSPHGPCRLPAPNGGIFRRLPHPLRGLLMTLLRPLGFRFFASPVLNRLRRRHGLPGLADFRQHYAAGSWCAYLDLPEFHPLSRLPQSHFFLGPVPWQPRGLPDFPLGELGRDRPLVYVTLGGSGDGAALRQVFEALDGLECEIALSGVEASAAGRLAGAFPTLAGRLRWAALADPARVLERAALTVCHGGSGTVYQSLAAGVPLLCLPSNPDQRMVAADCARAGAGLTVEVWRANRGRLVRAARTLLAGGSHREQARRMSGLLRARDTRARWLEFLERVPLPGPLECAHDRTRGTGARAQGPMALSRFAPG